MWTHNLHTICNNNQDVDNTNLSDIVSDANLGTYICSIMATVSVDSALAYDPALDNSLCLLIFTSKGLLCMSIFSDQDQDQVSTIYTFTGISGFIPDGHITHCDISHKRLFNSNLFKHQLIPILSVKTQARTYTFQYELTHYTKSNSPTASELKNTLHKYEKDSTNIVTEGNFFDLGNDPSFVGVEDHITALKKHYGNNTDYTSDQIVKIKANYTPKFKSHIFNDSIHIPRYFLASFTPKHILLFQLSKYHTYEPFFTGLALNISRDSLITEALYNPSPKKKWSVLVAPTFIITIFPVKQLPLVYLNFSHTHALTHYISHQDPVLIPKLSYHLFIKQQYKKIAHEYKSHQSLWQDMKSYISMKSISLALKIIWWTIISLVCFWSIPFAMFGQYMHIPKQPLSMIIFNILGSLIMFCMCFGTWGAYLHTQSISSKPAWIITILSVIIWIFTISSYF